MSGQHPCPECGGLCWGARCVACRHAAEASQPGPCRRCPRVEAYRTHGLCRACFMYEWRYKRPRPRYLTHGEPKVCANPDCGRELAVGKVYGNRCAACARWLRLYGVERPLLLVARLAWRRAQREEQAG
jgi:hypothetical protein